MKRSCHDHGISDVRAELAAMFDAGQKDTLLNTVCDLLSSTLAQANKLAARVADLQRQVYGNKKERVSANQLVLALEELLGDSANEANEPDAPAVPKPPSEGEPRLRDKAKKTKRRGRRPLPPELPREEIRIAPTDEQLAATSGNMSKMGEERSEVLEYEPARFKVLVYVREVWSNSVGEIVTAPKPDKVIDKGLPGPGLLTQVIISKYRDHCPLNRQVKIYERSGVELSRNTLVDWVAAAAFLLEPLARKIFMQVMMSYVVQADDTKLPVLDRKKAKNIKRGRLWAMVGDHTYVAFRYAQDWKGDTTAEILGARIGWLQADGYKGYEQIFDKGLAIEVGCWMHCRRYFVKAFERKDLRAATPLALIKQMYKIEKTSKDAGETVEQRLERRKLETQPIVDELKEWIDDYANREPPSTPLGKALTYATNQWSALKRPLEEGALELDNGDVERAIRGPAMGRRNWLFAGSDEGGKRAAILLTVIESAMRHGLDLREYIQDVLIKISSGWPNRRLEELLPHRWRELHSKSRHQQQENPPVVSNPDESSEPSDSVAIVV